MSDESTAGAGSAQPSEDELRQYLGQLRTVPADRVLLDALSSVLTAAQAKLGRRDARLMIDLSGLMFDHARAYLSAEPAKQFEQVLGQLRLAQVQAEQSVASSGNEEPNDLPQVPAPPAPGAAGVPPSGPQSPAQPPKPSPASKLWVPGSR